MIAYIITNSINNKSYIGITKSFLNKRFATHLYHVRKGTESALYNAIRKYGESAFTIQQVASSLSADYLPELEKILIIQYNTKCPFGYNMTDGGDGMSGWTPSEKQRAEASVRMKTFHKNEPKDKKEQRARAISEAKIGKPNLKLRGKTNAKGAVRTQKFKDKVSQSMKNYTSGIPEEMSRRGRCADPKKISEAVKVAWTKEGYKEKMSKKISDASKLKWKDPAQKERVRTEMREVWRKRREGLLPMPKRKLVTTGPHTHQEQT